MARDRVDHPRPHGLKNVGRELHSAGAADIDHLSHRVIEQRSEIWIVAHITDRPARQRA